MRGRKTDLVVSGELESRCLPFSWAYEFVAKIHCVEFGNQQLVEFHIGYFDSFGGLLD